MQYKKLEGEKFGELVVLEYLKGGYYRCICDCGTEKKVRTGHLKSGAIVSCGCRRRQYENLIGQKFSRLKVVEYSHQDGHEHKWKCLCDCGDEVIVGGNWLRSSNTRSCGCLQSDVTVERSTIHGLAVGKRKGAYNPEYEQYLRRRPQHKIRKTASKMAWYGLKKNRSSKRGGSLWNSLPYTVDDLKIHLESQFDDWMTWGNYGSEWSIDHIRPQSNFSYKSMDDDQFQECWALKNLRPLSNLENLKKGSKLLS
jgi:hypothetical protein